MKRFILFVVLMSFFICGNSQSSVGRLTFDSGYYGGVCQVSTDNKYTVYLYLQFLSNESDTMLVVVPYKMRNSSSPKVMERNRTTMNDTIENFLVELSEAVDDIENHEIVNRTWSIDGFDNFTYFEVIGDTLSFSINIADLETNTIEVFYFDGTISPTGNEINAVVESDNGTFQKNNIILQLSSRIIEKK